MTEKTVSRHRRWCRGLGIWIMPALRKPFSVPCNAESNMSDTIHHIREVVVTSKATYREVIPTQRLNGKQLKRLNSQSIADAMRYFAGVRSEERRVGKECRSRWS